MYMYMYLYRISGFFKGITVYREIFVLLNFHKFCEFCSVTKLHFTKVSPCHTFYIAHVDHSWKYFLQKFPGIWYILQKLLKFLFTDLIFAITIEQRKHVVRDFNILWMTEKSTKITPLKKATYTWYKNVKK